MKYNVTICDDEQNICRQLEEFLLEYQKEKPFSFDINIINSAEEYMAKNPQTDILLLDIQMGELDGLSLARKLRAENSSCIIIFITSMTQFAIEGYEVHAFGFLPKPISKAMLEMYLNEATSTLTRKNGLRMEFFFNTDHRVVYSKDILYFESYGHRINVHATEEVFPCILSLSKIEEDLSEMFFFRCHSSFLVNLKYIKKIGADNIELTNKESVMLSRRKRKLLMESYLKYKSSL